MKKNNRWVSFTKAKRRDLQTSTKQSRLVVVNGENPVKVLTPHHYRVPFLMRGCDQLAFVDMTPKRVALQIKGNVPTKDGIAVSGEINAQVTIKDDDSSIKRMVLNSEEEEFLLTDLMLSAVRESIILHTWQEITSVGEEFLGTAKQRLVAALNKANSCFTLVSLTINEMHPEDKTIALSFQEKQKSVLVRTAKKAELEGELEEQRLRNKAKLEEEKTRMLLESEREQAKITALIRRADLLRTEEGKIAAFPEEMFRQSIEELKFKTLQLEEERKLYRELLKATLSDRVSFQAGQFDAVRGILAQRFDIYLSEAPMLDLRGKIEGEKEKEANEVEEAEEKADRETQE